MILINRICYLIFLTFKSANEFAYLRGKSQPAQKRVSRHVEATIWWARVFFIFQTCRLGFSFFALAGAPFIFYSRVAVNRWLLVCR